MSEFMSIPNSLHYSELSSIISSSSSLLSDIAARTYSDIRSYRRGYSKAQLMSENKNFPSILFGELDEMEEELADYDITLEKAIKCSFISHYSGSGPQIGDISFWNNSKALGNDYETKFINSLASQLYITHNLLNTTDNVDIFSQYTYLPEKENFELSQLVADKDNYYCLYNALYTAYKQKKKSGKDFFSTSKELGNPYSEYPIAINVYPKNLQSLVETLAQRIFSSKSKIDGKDMDFVSVADSLGRGEVMIFHGEEPILIPTAQTLNSYNSTMSSFLRNDIDRYTKEKYRWKIASRDYDGSSIQFVDSTYSLRVILAAIQSIRANKIDDRNEVIPQPEHKLSEIIKRFPILTEIAKDESLLSAKLPEISVIAKMIQNEYDEYNFSKLTGNNLDKSSINELLNQRLTSEEKVIMAQLQAQQPLESAPPVVSYLHEKVNSVHTTLIEGFFASCEKLANKKSANDFQNVISEFSDYIQIKNVAMVLCYINDFTFLDKMDEKFLPHALFIRTISETKDINPITIAQAVTEGVEVTPDNAHGIQMLQNLAASETEKYLEKERSGEEGYSRIDLMSDLLLMRVCAFNPDIMKNSKNINIDAPLMACDFSPLIERCQQAISLATSNGFTLKEVRKELFNQIELCAASNDFSIFFNNSVQKKDTSNDFLDVVNLIEQSSLSYEVGEVNKRKERINEHLASIVPNSKERLVMSDIFSSYVPKLLETKSPESLCKLIVGLECAKSTPIMDVKAEIEDSKIH